MLYNYTLQYEYTHIIYLPFHSRARESSLECGGGDCVVPLDLPLPHQNGTAARPAQLLQPLITVTINPLEQNEITFVPPSPMVEARPRLDTEDERKLSIGSASSFDEDPEQDNSLVAGQPRDGAIRRVSDISHINELRREISGLSHLASEFYEVKKIDPDKLSLDSIHLRVLSRCANYQVEVSKKFHEISQYSNNSPNRAFTHNHNGPYLQSLVLKSPI